MEDISKLLHELIKTESVRSLSSKGKKYYKLLICDLCHNALTAGIFNLTASFISAKLIYEKNIVGDERLQVEDKEFIRVQNDVLNKLSRDKFIFPSKDSQLDLIIAFFRKYIINLIDKKQTLYNISELENIIDVITLMGRRGYKLKRHHLVEISGEMGMIPTFPEFFNYQDLINLWNDLIHKIEMDKDILLKIQQGDPVINSGDPRRGLYYSITSSYRTLNILAVNFVESYLYYYFYNIKSSNKYPANKLMKLKERKISDKQIVNDLIFTENPSIKEKLFDTFIEYEKVVNLRDRFVHTSVFIDSNNNVPQLQPLINITFDETVNNLQSCINFILQLEDALEEDEKLLFWFEIFEQPDFTKKTKISNLARKSR